MLPNPKCIASILLVEDDERIGKLLLQYLRSEQFAAEWVSSGEAAIEALEQGHPDIIILDLMLPKMDGLELCQRIRPAYSNSILMLTAHNGDIQEVTALNAGIDDFIAKPVRTHVLLARINALLRRQKQSAPQCLELLDISIDRDKRRVTRGAEVIHISDSDFELIWHLAINAGNVVTREDLFKAVRGKEYDGLDRSVDVRISKLRKKLNENNPAFEYIKTIRQLGYIFIKDI